MAIKHNLQDIKERIKEDFGFYIEKQVFHPLGFAVDHNRGIVEKRKNGHSLDFFRNIAGGINDDNGVYTELVPELEEIMKMEISDKEIINAAKKGYSNALDRMKQEEQSGYPTSFYRAYELGELVLSFLGGHITRLKNRTSLLLCYDSGHYTGVKKPLDRAFELTNAIDSNKDGIAIQNSAIWVPEHKVGYDRFPENYQLTIRPRSVGVHLVPEQAKRYQFLLSQYGKKVEIRHLLEMVGKIVNNSIEWANYKEIKDRQTDERLPAEPNKPFAVVQKPSRGYCLDAGEMIRPILFNLGLNDDIRIRYEGVPSPIGIGHDTTAVYDVKKGYAIFINSKEGNYEHPILLDFEQRQKRFFDREKG